MLIVSSTSSRHRSTSAASLEDDGGMDGAAVTQPEPRCSEHSDTEERASPWSVLEHRGLGTPQSPTQFDEGLRRTPARLHPVGVEQSVDELDRDRTLSDRRRHALDRAVSYITGGEHAGHTRL
jgi:hypothetical protein